MYVLMSNIYAGRPFYQYLTQVWSKVIKNGRFDLELIRQLHHVDQHKDSGVNVSAGISCILPRPHSVYTGDEAGRVVSPFISVASQCLLLTYQTV